MLLCNQHALIRHGKRTLTLISNSCTDGSSDLFALTWLAIVLFDETIRTQSCERILHAKGTRKPVAYVDESELVANTIACCLWCADGGFLCAFCAEYMEIESEID